MLSVRRWFVAAFLALAVPASALALTVDEVVDLSRSDVTDEVIVAQIDASGAVFQLSAADLIRLKQSGVSERVILHMIRTRSQAAARADANLRERMAERQQQEAERAQAPAPTPQYTPPAYTSPAPAPSGSYVVEQPRVVYAAPTYAPAPVYYSTPVYYGTPVYYPSHCAPSYYYPYRSYYSYPSYRFSLFYGGHRHHHHHRHGSFGFGIGFSFH